MNWQLIVGAIFFATSFTFIKESVSNFALGLLIGCALIAWGVYKRKMTGTSNRSAGKAKDKSCSKRTATISCVPDEYVVFDLETTGFSRKNDRIIEIAANRYSKGKIVAQFHSYVNPGRLISAQITNITGIRNADVKSAPTIDRIKKDILEFLGDYVLVGHNINVFDIPFLECQLDCKITNDRIDTLNLSKKVFPGLPSYKLTVLDQILQLGLLDHHRAENDILVNNALFLACFSPDKYNARISDPDLLNSINIESVSFYPSIDVTSFEPTDSNAIPNTQLVGKCVCFSGIFDLSREELCQIAVDAGATLKSKMSKNVDILVLGETDPYYADENGMCSKERTAREYISGGHHIKIIDETEFIRLAAEK